MKSGLRSKGYYVDLTGDRYSFLTVLSFSHKHKSHSMWNCICECGENKTVRGDHLTGGKTISCGCYSRKNLLKIRTKHGQSKVGHVTEEYRAWCKIKERCLNPNDKSYVNYGGRGITICQEWVDSFDIFFSDMGPKPKGTSIDRIDNEKGYFKENCRWATRKQQANNTRVTLFLENRGIRLPLSQWADIKGLKKATLERRIKYLGWPIEKALNTPLRGTNV